MNDTPDRGWKKIVFAIVLFLVFFIPSLCVGIYYYQQINKSMTDSVFAQRETIAQLTASAVQVRINKLIGIAETYASGPGVAQSVVAGNWTKAKDDVINLQNDPLNYDYFIGRFALLDSKGNVEVSFPGISNDGIGKPDEGLSQFEGPILQNGVASFVSNVTRRAVYPHTIHIEIFAPIVQASATVGVVEVSIPINEFSEFGTNVDVGDEGFVYIVDGLGQIISHPKYSPDNAIVDYSSLPVVQSVIQGQSGAGISYNSIEHQEVVAAYEPIAKYGWGVVAQDPVSDAFANRDAILQDIVYIIAAAGAIELIAALFILVFLTRKKK